MADRPNILLIQADQLSATALKCYGNNVTVTPTIDRLAAEGVVFTQSYCNYPLCAPSRFSMMAGQLASRIGAYDNGAEFPSGIPTFAHYLRAAGYKTCLSGKMHFIGADQLHGFDERLTSDIYPGDFVWAADWDEDQHRDTNGPSAVTIAGKCTGSVQIDYDEQVAARAVDWLGAQDAGGDPFLLTVSFTHPHDPFVCKKEYWDLYQDVEIPMPAAPPADDPHSKRMLHQYGMEPSAFTEDQIRTARRGYYGAVSYLDDKIAAVLDALGQAGLEDNTIVILTADHGEMLGEHGLWMKKLFFEEALAVPLIFHAPNRFGPARIDGLSSLVDLLPTLVGLTGAQPPIEDLSGMDLSPHLLSGSSLPDRPLLAELTCEGTPGPVLMLRRGTLKYVWSAVDPPMLFDLDQDPHECINLAGSKKHAAVEAALEQELLATWDPETLTRDIRLTQVRRRLVHRAHKATGTKPDWDYRESPTPDERWMRGLTSYNDWAFGSISGLGDD